MILTIISAIASCITLISYADSLRKRSIVNSPNLSSIRRFLSRLCHSKVGGHLYLPLSDIARLSPLLEVVEL